METEFGWSPRGTSLPMQVSWHGPATSQSKHFANGKVAIPDDSLIFPPLE
jgi:hypothetical protein